MKRLVTNEAASESMHVVDQIVELGGGCLVGGFELYGIQMIQRHGVDRCCTDNVYDRPRDIDRSC